MVASKEEGRMNFLIRYADVAKDVCSPVEDNSNPVTAGQREWRRKHNLCFDCGSPDHKCNSKFCPSPKWSRKDFTSVGGRFNREDSKEAAMIVAFFESIGMFECTKRLASEIWHDEEKVKKDNMDSISNFNKIWDRFKAEGQANEHGAWVPKYWNNHWVQYLSRPMRVSVMASFPTSFSKGLYEDEVHQKHPFGITAGTDSPSMKDY